MKRSWICLGVILLSSCSQNIQSDHLEAARLNVQLGDVYLAQHQLDLAKIKYLKAVELAPQWPETHVALGRYYEAEHQVQAAQAEYQRALTLDAHDPAVLDAYGVFLCKTKQFSAGEAYLQKALSQTQITRMGDVYDHLGDCAQAAGEPLQAIQEWRKALGQNPQFPEPYLKLAQIYYVQKHYEQSLIVWNQYNQLATPSIASLNLGIQLAKVRGDENQVAALTLQLNGMKSTDEKQ